MWILTLLYSCGVRLNVFSIQWWYCACFIKLTNQNSFLRTFTWKSYKLSKKSTRLQTRKMRNTSSMTLSMGNLDNIIAANAASKRFFLVVFWPFSSLMSPWLVLKLCDSLVVVFLLHYRNSYVNSRLDWVCTFRSCLFPKEKQHLAKIQATFSK